MSNVKKLIEERAKKLDENLGMAPEKWVCMETGMYFKVPEASSPMYSPFTGGTEIEPAGNGDYDDEYSDDYSNDYSNGYNGYPMEAVNPSEYMKPTGLPPGQGDPHKQVPPSANPAPAQPGAGSWQNTPWAPNPAPDASGAVGASSANPQGYVPYPQSSVPPHVEKKPGEKT